jgi:MOSC domain-containing protein YiiM
MRIRQIFVSPGHNYFGHHGRAPDDHPLVEVREIECVAGHGIRGDRFYDYRDDYKGQITFFSYEVFERLVAHFDLTNKSPGALRRNLVVSGVELNDLIGEEFSIQGVRLRGTAHCRPCYWLDQAVAPGAEKFLEGNGGLRAQILSDGVIAAGDARLIRSQPQLDLRETGGTGAVPSH